MDKVLCAGGGFWLRLIFGSSRLGFDWAMLGRTGLVLKIEIQIQSIDGPALKFWTVTEGNIVISGVLFILMMIWFPRNWGGKDKRCSPRRYCAGGWVGPIIYTSWFLFLGISLVISFFFLHISSLNISRMIRVILSFHDILFSCLFLYKIYQTVKNIYLIMLYLEWSLLSYYPYLL